jgi:hypothetical protein
VNIEIPNEIHETISLSNASNNDSGENGMQRRSRKRKLYEIADLSDKDCDFVD